MALTELIGALVAVVVLVALAGIVFMGVYQSTAQNAKKQEAQGPQEEAVQAAPAAARRRNAMADSRRRRAMQASSSRTAAEDEDSASETGSDDGEDERQAHLPRSKKERRKQQKQEEKEARAEAVNHRQQKLSAYEERRQAEQEKKNAIKRAQEEEMQRAKEEQERKENEEAAKWMSMMKVEQEGTGEGDDQEEGEGLLSQFIDYIKKRKTVPLEQLATEFKLRTTDVINRVQGLEAMGVLTGVMDERGKYIYISMEEMEAVAKYITTKGRVAISELAAKSNTFIDLEAKSAVASASGQPALDFDALLADGAAAAS